jgi:N-acetyl-anhydromuramyl-L-alanine amidase AmpD
MAGEVSAIVLPELVWRESPNRSSRNGAKVRLLVWHETAGAYAGSVSWLCNPAADASAHLVVREDGLEATQLVPLAEKAWHAAAFNGGSVGVEHANTTAKGYASERQLKVSARIFGWLCLHLGVPPRRSRTGHEPGIARHLDLGAAGGGHTQCGMGEHDFERFLAMVHAELERGGYRTAWAR